MSHLSRSLSVVAGFTVIASLAACAPGSTSSRTAAVLGTAESFSVLAGLAETNTGPTTIVGNVGLSPGVASSISGFPPGMVTGGVMHAGDGPALQAQADVTTAYNSLAGQPCDFNLTGLDLGGRTLTAGVYCFSSSAQLTGALTLDAQGNPAALFVFQIGSTLTTASNSSVRVINAGQACNAFWQVGSSATLGTTTAFVGNILALTSISLTTGAQVSGRVLARNGAVTMDTNHIAAATCAVTGQDAGPATSDAGPATSDAGPAHTCRDTPCGDVCVDLKSDHFNCGGCGNVCNWDLSCVAGSCTCQATTCGNICVELSDNPDNCGACGNVCAANQFCDRGSCTAACAGTICDRWCTDLMWNNDACGACGHKCGSAEACMSGTCICTGAMCGSTCFDLSTSLSNCGTCGTACKTDQCCTDGKCALPNPLP